MVRSGQMVLATALNRHILGPDWRLPTSSEEDKAKHAVVRDIVCVCVWWGRVKFPQAPVVQLYRSTVWCGQLSLS